MKKHAVLVGVNHYEDKQNIAELKCSFDDVVSMDKVLERLGFVTTRLYDPSHDDIREAIRNAIADLRAGDVFLFFFSGHGFSIGDRNFVFCPSDRCSALGVGAAAGLDTATIDSAAQAARASEQFDRIFVYDACRNYRTGVRGSMADPEISFPDGTKINTRDLNPLERYAQDRGGSDVIYRSCKRGEFSHEWYPNGRMGNGNGVFTQALADIIRERINERGDVRIDSSFHEDVVTRVKDILLARKIYSVQTPEIRVANRTICLRPAVVGSPKETENGIPPTDGAKEPPSVSEPDWSHPLPAHLTEPLREIVVSAWRFCSDTMALNKNKNDSQLQKAFGDVLTVSYDIWQDVFEKRRRAPGEAEVHAMTIACRKLATFIEETLCSRRSDFRAKQCLAEVRSRAEKLKGTPCAALSEALLACVQERP